MDIVLRKQKWRNFGKITKSDWKQLTFAQNIILQIYSIRILHKFANFVLQNAGQSCLIFYYVFSYKSYPLLCELARPTSRGTILFYTFQNNDMIGLLRAGRQNPERSSFTCAKDGENQFETGKQTVKSYAMTANVQALHHSFEVTSSKRK